MRRYDSHPSAKVKGAALAAALALLPAIATARDADCPAAGSETAVAVAAIDGATLKLADGRVLRLAGVEAPRRPLALAGDAPWPAAEAARRALERLTAGQTLSLAPVASTADRYGRFHAYVFLPDGRLMESVLAEEGVVRARAFPGEAACFRALLGAERPARTAGRGLWADAEYAVRRADDPSLPAQNGLYEEVEGAVISVGHGTRMTFLDFGHDFRSDFTVMIAPDVAKALVAGGLPPEGFAGRRVRVRGVIEESGGPAIRLSNPAEIEFATDDDAVNER